MGALGLRARGKKRKSDAPAKPLLSPCSSGWCLELRVNLRKSTEPFVAHHAKNGIQIHSFTHTDACSTTSISTHHHMKEMKWKDCRYTHARTISVYSREGRASIAPKMTHKLRWNWTSWTWIIWKWHYDSHSCRMRAQWRYLSPEYIRSGDPALDPDSNCCRSLPSDLGTGQHRGQFPVDPSSWCSFTYQEYAVIRRCEIFQHLNADTVSPPGPGATPIHCLACPEDWRSMLNEDSIKPQDKLPHKEGRIQINLAHRIVYFIKKRYSPEECFRVCLSTDGMKKDNRVRKGK